MNLVEQFCLKTADNLAAEKSYWDDACIDLAGEVVEINPGSRLAYFMNPDGTPWRYHAAVELDGMIHDLWYPEVMPTEKFIELIDADSVEYPAEQITV